MAKATWYRLDNIGKFYSSQAGITAQTVFRFSATLKDDVDATALQHALEQTVGDFPNFNVCLRSGMFWHYLEQSSKVPAVAEETLPICYGVYVDAKSVLIRVSYYKRRINLELSHIVSDGRGASSFFRALLYEYIKEAYGVSGISSEYDGSDQQKAENSFDKYYEHDKAAGTHVSRAYRLPGIRDTADPTFIEYHLPTDKVLGLSRTYGVSMTSLVIAFVICAIRQDMPHRFRKRAIRVNVPVDLRQIFESTTTRNFFGLAFVSYTPGDKDESLQDIAVDIQAQLKEATQAEHLKQRMNRMIALEKNLLLRFAPLFAKDFILEMANRLNAHQSTLAVSNLGAIVLDEQVAPFVQDINILTTTNRMSMTICSYNNELSIGISTLYSSLDVIKNFCRMFSSNGIFGHINISRSGKEISESRLRAAVDADKESKGGRL